MIRRSADPVGTHTVRFHPGRIVAWAIVCLVVSGYFLFFGIGGLVSPSTYHASALAAEIVVTIGVGFALLGIRAQRIGVEASAGKLTIRNMWRTRVVAASDIRVINVEVHDSISNGPGQWMPRVHLADETSIWLGYFHGGPARKPPKPGLAAKVDRARVVLDVAGNVPVIPESL